MRRLNKVNRIRFFLATFQASLQRNGKKGKTIKKIDLFLKSLILKAYLRKTSHIEFSERFRLNNKLSFPPRWYFISTRRFFLSHFIFCLKIISAKKIFVLLADIEIVARRDLFVISFSTGRRKFYSTYKPIFQFSWNRYICRKF